MSDLRRMFLVANAFAGLLLVATITSKMACPGDSVQAFQNIKFDRCNSFVSLNVYDGSHKPIATWSMHNCTPTATFLADYKERLFLDETGAIYIRNVHYFDQGRYIVISQTDSLPLLYDVEISVMIAPTKDCMPKIVRLKNSLLASLNANDCGSPITTLYWKDNDGVPITHKNMLMLPTGKVDGKYNACIEGPALLCVRNTTTRNYCSSITIEESNSYIKPLETVSSNAVIVLGVVVALLLTLAIIVIAILIRKSRTKNKDKINKEAYTDHRALSLQKL